MVKLQELGYQKSLQQTKSHKERLQLLHQTLDENGNIYIIGEEERIYLRKSGTTQDISIGKVLVGEKNLLYYKFEDEKNLFRKTNAWSINYKVFEQVDYIIYETTKFVYQINKTRAEEFGDITNFSNEKKLNVSLVYWDIRPQEVSETEQRRRNLLGDSWYEILKDTINSPYMSEIGNKVRKRRQEVIVYPDERDVFRALKITHPKQAKVIIVGQNPYHDGSANGLAFGYKSQWIEGQRTGVVTKPVPKSLDIICKEIEKDMYDGLHLDFEYTLQNWAEQGVLLLNSSLTVERGNPNSHLEYGWQRFVKIVLWELIKDISPKVYLLWGNKAQELFQEVVNKIGIPAHSLILKAKHPAADLYKMDDLRQIKEDYPNTFSGCRHFSKTNEFLIKNKRKPITW